MHFQSYVLPLLCGVITVTALIRGVNVFDAFIQGAKEGVKTAAAILPTLCALFFAVDIFISSGAGNAVSYMLHPLAALWRIPDAVVPLMILRPLSGSGASAFFKTLIERVGVNSLAGRTAAVMLGSSETTMYTLSVYYGAAGVKKTGYTLPCALAGDIAAFISAGILTQLFFK